ncbi:hypothetical protein BJ138DRAFT_929075 [Hygrophoropsis aurantiaca]|uniref:Uncharacterized protein n=1 Tax=Hygrophoropsis aurantiaca TaxID=72124 RepID=A0ACB8ADB2_9AGAM|nr:hypothetical protein BJ138DRAFT_929075 [Hygrophoropsis aurantiaca]
MNVSHARHVVDKCTPRDKYARTHMSVTNSLIASADDTALETTSAPWGHARTRSKSTAGWIGGWKKIATPIRQAFRTPKYEEEPLPQSDSGDEEVDDDDTRTENFDFLDRSLCNVEFDASCLDFLDHQLLTSPTDSFSEVCWTEGTHDDYVVPVLQPIQPRIRKRVAYYDRTAGSEEDPYHDWDENLSVKIHRRPPKPLPKLPIPERSTSPASPKSSTSSSLSYQDAMLAVLESRILNHNPNDSVHFFPIPIQRRLQQVEQLRKTSTDAPSLDSTSSGGRLRRLSSACSTAVGRSRAKSSA